MDTHTHLIRHKKCRDQLQNRTIIFNMHELNINPIRFSESSLEWIHFFKESKVNLNPESTFLLLVTRTSTDSSLIQDWYLMNLVHEFVEKWIHSSFYNRQMWKTGNQEVENRKKLGELRDLLSMRCEQIIEITHAKISSYIKRKKLYCKL